MLPNLPEHEMRPTSGRRVPKISGREVRPVGVRRRRAFECGCIRDHDLPQTWPTLNLDSKLQPMRTVSDLIRLWPFAQRGKPSTSCRTSTARHGHSHQRGNAHQRAAASAHVRAGNLIGVGMRRRRASTLAQARRTTAPLHHRGHHRRGYPRQASALSRERNAVREAPACRRDMTTVVDECWCSCATTDERTV